MAKATTDSILNNLKGKLSKNSLNYFTTRYGKLVVSNYPTHRDPKKITPHQHELNVSFAQAVQQAKVELSDPQKRAEWQQRFEEQKTASEKPYVTLRNFVIAQLTKGNN